MQAHTDDRIPLDADDRSVCRFPDQPARELRISDARLDDVSDPVSRSILVRLADRRAYRRTADLVTGPRGPDRAKWRRGAT